MHSLVQHFWDYFRHNVSEFHLVVTCSIVLLVVSYFVCSLPYFLLDVLQIGQQWKIQESIRPTSEDLWHCFWRLAVLFAFVISPLVCLAFPIFKVVGIHTSPEVPSLHVILIQIVFFFVVEDFGNYWLHRLLHWGVFYSKIHIVHHKHHAPFAMSATYAHPLEVVLLGIPTFAGPVLLAPHIMTLWLWVFWRQLEAVHTHSGYAFPFGPENFLPFFGGPAFHDYHHKYFVGNYASTFTYLDRIYGTDKGWRRAEMSKG